MKRSSEAAACNEKVEAYVDVGAYAKLRRAVKLKSTLNRMLRLRLKSMPRLRHTLRLKCTPKLKHTSEACTEIKAYAS